MAFKYTRWGYTMLLPFTRSQRFTMGTELELQLTDSNSTFLTDKADLILADIGHNPQIKHELTKSMIEINSSVHTSIVELHSEIVQLAMKIRSAAVNYGCDITGGGRHLDGGWRDQVISDPQRYQDLALRYGYISKMACVFGQHIHIGVSDGDEAIYLCHALLPYLPHLIALSASSPWLDGEDTHFSSSRFTGQIAFLNSDVPERVYNWNEFSEFYEELLDAGIINSIKDIYWYVRPQPGFGSVEIRICDMPLTLFHATMLTGYCKLLVRLLLEERQQIVKPHYAIEKYNIFNARRDGLHAKYTYTFESRCQRVTLAEHIQQTIDKLYERTAIKEDIFVLQYMQCYVDKGINDSDSIREMIKHSLALNTVTRKMRKVFFAVPREYRSLFPVQ